MGVSVCARAWGRLCLSDQPAVSNLRHLFHADSLNMGENYIHLQVEKKICLYFAPVWPPRHELFAKGLRGRSD